MFMLNKKRLKGVENMEIAKYILIGLDLFVCVALIVITTMQTKDDQGASGTIVGSSTDNFYEKNKGRTKEGKLKKWTVILGILFVLLTVALGIIYVAVEGQ